MNSKMPVLFIGHGSPTNAIENNPFTRTLVKLAKKIPKPEAILCISAHWLTAQTWLSHTPYPVTLHDFHKGPAELFTVNYPAPGAPELAEKIKGIINEHSIELDEHWGFDQGVWIVGISMYPKANIPIVQLSINMAKPSDFHFELGASLNVLRRQGVLIIGSGNIVHNEKKLLWDDQYGKPYPWAIEFEEQVKRCLIQRDYTPLQGDLLYTEVGRFSVPTLEHYLPLLYALGASDAEDALQFEFEGIQFGCVSMLSLSLGL
ncbi:MULTISPECIES: 4,5-DOPA dioxygenase extradiol [Legionella]|uniref:Dioxygenase n=1 Tax=Legionella drozanskii LLAP-1 TaxID=1212489 RepID=A0A0W0T841_9GAMM|nr:MULTISPECIES: 4,5-DOPA dioxygenase extradiol [Legionella]KTC91784.1 dioxygenase [Legionella drozanskii LLAP-1]PJE18001.1 MAG: 4,5-DOPA dioxygenase extradiol [Legionella sp.]